MPTPIDRPWPSAPVEASTPGHFAGFRMTAENRIAAAECVECVDGKKPLVGQHDIERDAAVPLAQDHAVTVMPLRL